MRPFFCRVKNRSRARTQPTIPMCCSISTHFNFKAPLISISMIISKAISGNTTKTGHRQYILSVWIGCENRSASTVERCCQKSPHDRHSFRMFRRSEVSKGILVRNPVPGAQSFRRDGNKVAIRRAQRKLALSQTNAL